MLNRMGNRTGSALVEFALTAPLMMLMLIGAAEVGRIAYAAIEVSNAARAGVAYGSQSLTAAALTSNIQQAAKNEAPNITDLIVTVTDSCVCETVTLSSGATTSTNITDCSGTASTAGTQCPASTNGTTVNNILQYVQVTTQGTVKTMFHYPGIPTSFTLNGFAQMRVVQG
jgi:Flp pilus assembly protein TadG